VLRYQTIFPRSLAFAVTIFMTSPAICAEPAPDPAMTTYGAANPEAPRELATFAFLVGTWAGTARNQDAEGRYTEYAFEWIGRYVLDGMAIADEMRVPGGAVQGMSLRAFDADRRKWVIEYLNFNRSFLRKQVNAEYGDVTQDGTQITITQPGPGAALARERYTIVDATHFTYSMDMSQDGGQTWDEGLVMMEMQKEEGR
jgi:hypothetical protein